MKVLMTTQVVDRNHDVLGALHQWIAKIAERVDRLDVICLYEGEHDLPDNVRVFSMGKESGRKSRLRYLWKMYGYAWRLLRESDVLFVHMNHLYVILLWPLAFLFRKPIVLWKAHPGIQFSLRVATLLSNRIMTVSSDSFQMEISKKRIVGHGVDTDMFHCLDRSLFRDRLEIITVGRISPIKHYETLLRAVSFLRDRGIRDFHTTIVGGPTRTEDHQYLEGLKALVDQLSIRSFVTFKGPIPNKDIISSLCSADLFITMQHEGGVGKAFLEAMSSGLLTFICTNDLDDVLGEAASYFVYKPGDFEDLAKKISGLLTASSEDIKRYQVLMRDIVVEHHNLDLLMDRLVSEFQTLL